MTDHVVVVGFRVTEENSVYYKKSEIPSWDMMDLVRDKTLQDPFFGKLLREAYQKGADFVSIRFIRGQK